MQGAVWSCITCGVQYTMHQSTQKSFRDALEMHWKSAEFNMQGHTLTCGLNQSLRYLMHFAGETSFSDLGMFDGMCTGGLGFWFLVFVKWISSFLVCLQASFG